MAASGGNLQYPLGSGLAADFGEAAALISGGFRCRVIVEWQRRLAHQMGCHLGKLVTGHGVGTCQGSFIRVVAGNDQGAASGLAGQGAGQHAGHRAQGAI